MTPISQSQSAHSALLADLRRYRHEVDIRLRATTEAAFGPGYFLNEVRRCLRQGRRLRAIIYIKMRTDLKTPLSEEEDDRVITAIEFLHAASILVDDFVDGDDVRHGQVVTERQWGGTKSTMFAHLLVSEAFQQLRLHGRLQAELLNVYQNMTAGEMYDLLLPTGDWMYAGYDNRTSRKTSALFEFAFAAAAGFDTGREALRRQMAGFGRRVGELFQMSNDFHDWQPGNFDKRRVSASEWPVTFSFPLATYLRKRGDISIRHLLSKQRLNRAEWHRLYEFVWNDDVRTECFAGIERHRQALLNDLFVMRLPDTLRSFLGDFVKLVTAEFFWYHRNDDELA